MNEIYGLPQPLTGTETVTIRQEQNGQWALCTMPISTFATWVFAGLPTTGPATAGIPWNNKGVVSIS